MHKLVLAMIASALLPLLAVGQSKPAAESPGAPPKVLLLVYQQFFSGRSGPRQILEAETARSFDQFDVPVSWIELESLTGQPEALFFDPASSFAEIDKAGAMLAAFYATHADILQSQQRIEEAIQSSRTVTAVRRDDLGYRAETIDLPKARYFRIRLLQARPEKARDLENALARARTTPETGSPEATWVVYQINAGAPDMSFLVVEPMRSLAALDQGLARSPLDRIAREAETSSQSNLYAIHPEMSHVSKEFAAGDPAYWARKTTP